jgi:hypothetical protein
MKMICIFSLMAIAATLIAEEQKPATIETNPLVSTAVTVHDDGLVTVEIDGLTLRQIIDEFQNSLGVNIIAGDGVNDERGSNSVSLSNLKWNDALNTLLGTHGFVLVQRAEGIFVVIPNEEKQAELDRERDAKSEENEAIFEGILSGAILQNYLEATKEVLADAEYPKILAKHQRLYYLALIEEGFSEEQAFKLLLASDPVRSLGGD